jgi:RHS repeat-associated protein
MEKVTDWLGKETTFGYNRDSQVKAMTFPAETTNVDEYSYDKADQLAEVSMKKKAEVLASMTYTRDKLGQIEKSVDTGFTEEAERKYEYDTKNRLTKSNGTIFEYDAANNVAKIAPTTYTYDKADQIATASNATFEYNKVGQRIKETPTGKSAIPYTYDQAGNLILTKNEAIENTFKYDGTGLRTTETRGASTYPMVWDITAGLPLMLRGGNDYFIYGPGGLPIEQITSGSATYLHHDQLGSIRILTGSSGAVTGTYRYGPNGAVWAHTGTGTSSMGFAGQYRMHTENQLIYLRARTYDPVTAQFLSVDPMTESTGEPYSYAGGNPVNANDPTGLQTDSFCLQGSVSAGNLLGASIRACIAVDGHGQQAFTLTVGGGFQIDRDTLGSVGGYLSSTIGVDAWNEEQMSEALNGVFGVLDAKAEGDFAWEHTDKDTVDELAGWEGGSSTGVEASLGPLVFGFHWGTGSFGGKLGFAGGLGNASPLRFNVSKELDSSYTWVKKLEEGYDGCAL